MAIGSFCGISPFMFRQKSSNGNMKILKSSDVSKPKKERENMKSDSSRGWAGNFILIMELRKKIFIFRDIIDLPPFDGSASIRDLLLRTTRDLHKLFPEIIPGIRSSDMKEASIEQALAYFCSALKSIGDSWMTNQDCSTKSKYNTYGNMQNNSLEQLVKQGLESLECVIKAATEKFDMMDDEDMNKEYHPQTYESCSEISSSCDSPHSPVTPTSVLPEYVNTAVAYTPSLLLPLRVQALGKLNPIDVKRLSFYMFPHAVAQESRTMIQDNKTVEQPKLETEELITDVTKDEETINGLELVEMSTVTEETIEDVGNKDVTLVRIPTIQEIEASVKILSVPVLPPQTPPIATIPPPPPPPHMTRPSLPPPTESQSNIISPILSPSAPPSPKMSRNAIPPPPPPSPKMSVNATPPPAPPQSPEMAMNVTPSPLPQSPKITKNVPPPPPPASPKMSINATPPPPLPPQLPKMTMNVTPPPPPLPQSPKFTKNVPPPSASPKLSTNVIAPPPPTMIMPTKGSSPFPPPPMPPKTIASGPPPPPPPMMAIKGSTPFPPPPRPPTNGAAGPPPPPPGGAARSSLRPKKAATKLKRSSNMGNLYRVLKGKVEGSCLTGKSTHGRKSQSGGSNTGSSQGMADALAEMTKRSSYFLQIEADVQKYEKTIIELKPIIASFQTKDMSELLKFHKYVESQLENLTDESQVLSRFEGFPTKKLEALRMAAALYLKLDTIVTNLTNWKIVAPLNQLLDKVESYFNKIKGEVDALERTKDDEAKKFLSHNIHFDFHILVKIKESMVDVSSGCMELALKEGRAAKAAPANEGSMLKKGVKNTIGSAKILWKAFQFAFRVYTFAGGQDDRADMLTRELAQEIETEH